MKMKILLPVLLVILLTGTACKHSDSDNSEEPEPPKTAAEIQYDEAWKVCTGYGMNINLRRRNTVVLCAQRHVQHQETSEDPAKNPGSPRAARRSHMNDTSHASEAPEIPSIMMYWPMTSIQMEGQEHFYYSTLTTAAMIRHEGWKLPEEDIEDGKATSRTEMDLETLGRWFPKVRRLEIGQIRFAGFQTSTLHQDPFSKMDWKIDFKLVSLVLGRYKQECLERLARIHVESLQSELQDAEDTLDEIRRLEIPKTGPQRA